MDSLSRFGIGAGLGGIGAGVGAMMMGDNKNPYDEASKYFNQIPGTISPYFNPYINAGQQALPQLQQQYGNLINDPTGMMNKIGAGYHQSPGYQFQVQQAQNAANNAAGAGGMLGTPQHQYNSANMVNGIANQDYYNYLTHGLSLYGTGLQGLDNMNQTGFKASDELAGGLANNLMSQGNLAYTGAVNQNQQKGSELGDLFSGVGMLAAFL